MLLNIFRLRLKIALRALDILSPTRHEQVNEYVIIKEGKMAVSFRLHGELDVLMCTVQVAQEDVQPSRDASCLVLLLLRG